MTSPVTETSNGHQPQRTAVDEMSLADERAAQTAASQPDTLEVRDDSRAIVEGTVNDLRRPLLIVAAVAGVGVLALVILGVLVRKARHDVTAAPH